MVEEHPEVDHVFLSNSTMEHFLNLAFQHYFGEFWDELQGLKFATGKTIEQELYGLVFEAIGGEEEQ